MKINEFVEMVQADDRPALVIVRGLPGSGKSTLARKLSVAMGGAMVLEPDALHIQAGKYKYRGNDKHRDNFDITERFARFCVQILRADVIITDVICERAIIDRLAAMTKRQKLSIHVIDMPRLTREQIIARNVHNVREVDIDTMLKHWSPCPGAITIEEEATP